MPRNIGTCFACLEKKELTLEHVLPQAIGGRLKVRIYCKECNDTFGRQLDHEVSRCFSGFATTLGIKRERGTTRPYEVEDVETGTKLLSNGKSLKRKEPVVQLEVENNGKTLKSANIIARSEGELKKIITSLERKYTTKRKPKSFPEHHPGPTDTRYDFVFDTWMLRRSVAKIAYSFLCHKLPSTILLSTAFNEVRSYVIGGIGDDRSSANFVDTSFMTDYVRPLHKVHISLNRRQNLVIGYIMFFGTFRYTTLLSRSYISRFDWPCLDHTIDPVTGNTIEGNPNFRAPLIDEQHILKPRQSKQLVLEEIHKGHKILENYAEGYQHLKIELENREKGDVVN
ncbi:MAG: hypothetical protein JRF64_05675 [Deltaproteobacteria bacterium]|nr:hypothetical protein [Deltaproteobacteria bacterium]